MVTTNVAGDSVTLRVVGPFNGEAVRELERHWQQAQDGKSQIQMDLSCAYDMDREARRLIAEMFADGVELLIFARPNYVQ